MTTPPPPGGRRIVPRAMFYGFTFLAIVAVREHLRSGDGPLQKSLGHTFNTALSATAKLGLGVSLLHDRREDPKSWMSRNSRKLEKISHDAYVSSAKVKLYGE